MSGEALRERIAEKCWQFTMNRRGIPLSLGDCNALTDSILAAIAETHELHPKGTGKLVERVRYWCRTDLEPDRSLNERMLAVCSSLRKFDLGEPQAGEG